MCENPQSLFKVLSKYYKWDLLCRRNVFHYRIMWTKTSLGFVYFDVHDNLRETLPSLEHIQYKSRRAHLPLIHSCTQYSQNWTKCELFNIKCGLQLRLLTRSTTVETPREEKQAQSVWCMSESLRLRVLLTLDKHGLFLMYECGFYIMYIIIKEIFMCHRESENHNIYPG